MPVIISRDLVLSTSNPDEMNGDNPLIGWHNLTVAAGVNATSQATGYPVTNIANVSTYAEWRATTAGDQAVGISVPTDVEIDYLAVAGHNFGTAGSSLSVEGDIGAGFFSLNVDAILAEDWPVLFRFEPQTLQGIRLLMNGNSVAPRAAVIYVGKLLLLQRRIYVGHTPVPYGRNAKVITGRSENGKFLGRVVTTETRETGVSIQNLTPSWYRTEMDPFIEASKEIPFFFAWRPLTYIREVGYCWMTNEPKPKNSRGNGMMSIDLQMEGIA